MNFEYVKKYYNVPACIGRRVVAFGKTGVIAKDGGNYIGVLLDCDSPRSIGLYHPRDLTYLNEVVPVRKMTRSQQRYQRFLEYGDAFDSFMSFCRWDASKDRSWN